MIINNTTLVAIKVLFNKCGYDLGVMILASQANSPGSNPGIRIKK